MTIALENVTCLVCGSGSSATEATGRDYMYGSCDDLFSMVRCTDCGHIYLNPRPTREMASIIYPDTYVSYQGTLAQPGGAMRSIKRAIVTRRFRKAVGHLDRARVLEIGCGDGDLLVSLKDAMPALDMTGLDFRFHPSIRQRLEGAHIALIEGLAEAAPLPEAHYDVIIMNQLVEHLWDVDLVLQRCRAAMKKGAIITLETPNPDAIDRRLFRRSLWGNYYFPRHLNLFRPDGIARVLARNGFRIIRQHDLLGPLCWVFTMHSIAAAMPQLSWLRRLFRLTNPVPVAAFAAVDLVVHTVGLHTSNQKVVAVRD